MKYQAVAVTKTRMFFTDHRTGEETVPATQKKVGLLHQKIRDKMTALRIGGRRPLTPERLQKLNEVPVGFKRGRCLNDTTRRMDGGAFMKRTVLALMLIAMGFFTYSCASEGYNTQKGAAIGAAVGALAGQAIGHNTAGTLIGVAGGALAGAIAGNAVDQDQQNKKAMQAPPQPVYATPAPSTQEVPPGEWVMVPGQWIGGKWVPEHRQWVPINPR